jgi:CheY-specific phosphatase CheX
MCFLSAEPDQEQTLPTDSLVFARCLAFDGPFTGRFGVRTSSDAALMIACNLLGFDADEMTPEQVGESIGELTNMFCGAVLCRIEVKRAFTLSQPMEDGEPLAATNSMRHLVRHFDVEGGRLQTWLEIDEAA